MKFDSSSKSSLARSRADRLTSVGAPVGAADPPDTPGERRFRAVPSMPKQHRPRRLLIVSIALVILVAGVYGVADELRSSRLQAMLFVKLAHELRFKVEAGSTDDIRFPGSGPYDRRLGYQQLPALVNRMAGHEFEVTAQARMSPRLLEFSERGLFPTYREKDQAGLEVLDCRGKPLFKARVPERVYERFEDVPPLLVDALLFIENRGLLDSRSPTLNPAVDWDRLSRAVLDRAWHLADRDHASPGGSTLATQIEKFRHSPEGRTESASEKLRQMMSASLRAYIDGEETLPRRRQIVVSYMNTVPLAAKAGFGEVHGLGDGLWAWYGRDFASVNQLLRTYRPDDDAAAPLPTRRRALAFKHALIFKQAEAYKQALSLMIAQRRPSHYLADGAPSLRALTDSYLRIMADAGVISPALRDATLGMPLELQARPVAERPISFVEHKAATAVRGTLSYLLDTPRSYDLDRFDLVARTSINGDAQEVATRFLRRLDDPAAARAAGLYGFHLLNQGDDLRKLFFSFTLLERGDHANLLRVQTDSGDQPFDINEGARLDLGSTAKLRLDYVPRSRDRFPFPLESARRRGARAAKGGTRRPARSLGLGLSVRGDGPKPGGDAQGRDATDVFGEPGRSLLYRGRVASIRELRSAGQPPRADRARGADSLGESGVHQADA